MKNLSTKGLSMSQATSISNLCFQRASEIENKLNKINNSSKTVKVDGTDHNLQKGVPIYEDVVKLLEEKGSLHATQAFLMENIKEKDRLLKEKQNSKFVYNVEAPVMPMLESAKMLPQINESWAWENMDKKDYAEYLEAEAMASHIGKFIHKTGRLSVLREELNTISELEWMSQPGKSDTSHAVKVSAHHDPEQLLKIHEELAEKHRKYEQKVNYYKAKTKNATSVELSRISSVNAQTLSDTKKTNDTIMEKYRAEHAEYIANRNIAEKEFEAKKHKEIKEIAGLKIALDPRFQPTVDLFLKDLQDGKKAE